MGLLLDVLEDAVACTPGLQKLGDIGVVLKVQLVAVETVVLSHGFVDDFATSAVFLVAAHRGRVYIELVFRTETTDGCDQGITLKTILGHESAGLLGVFLKGLYNLAVKYV